MSSSRRFVPGIPPKIKTTPPVTAPPAPYPLHAIAPQLRVKFGERVLRGERTDLATAADIEVDLRQQGPVPAGVMERLRSEGHATGYAEGWAEGRRESRLAVEAVATAAHEHARTAAKEQAIMAERALMALAAATAGLERRIAPMVTDLEDTIIAAAFALAETVVARELSLSATPGTEAVARALALAPKNRPVTVRLHPADLATIDAGGADPDGRLDERLDGRTVTLVADDSLRPGDAVADCDATTVDARLGPALARAREVLGLPWTS